VPCALHSLSNLSFMDTTIWDSPRKYACCNSRWRNHASVCILGLGERAGNAALEEVVAGLNCFSENKSSVDLAQLPRLAKLVAAASPPLHSFREVDRWRECIYSRVRNPRRWLDERSRTYEELSPQTFGRDRTIVLGKHSGTASVAGALHSLGLSANELQMKLLLKQIQERSMQASAW